MYLHADLLIKLYYTIHSREIETLHFFQWKILDVLFEVIDGENEPSSCQEMLVNSTRQYLK